MTRSVARSLSPLKKHTRKNGSGELKKWKAHGCLGGCARACVCVCLCREGDEGEPRGLSSPSSKSDPSLYLFFSPFRYGGNSSSAKLLG
jgi:hypothetical protein